MGTGIVETIIAVVSVAIGALGFYVKAKFTEYMNQTKKEIDERLDANSDDLKQCLIEKIDHKLDPVIQKQTDHSNDIERLKDKTNQHSVDIKGLETLASNLIKSNERLLDKFDRYFESNSNKQ